MATFDPEHGAVTLRIVYDGLGLAGKTTNLRQLHALFTLARQGDVVVPEEHRGRTLFFDWLELSAGYIDELPLRCQVVSVPGQFAYAHRRWALLRDPDAIVEVCDSSPLGVTRARYGLDFVRGMLRSGRCPDVPLIVQANKQDLPDALPVAEVARRLALDPDVRVVEACAGSGVGVRNTFVLALLGARERARRLLEQRGLEGLERTRETADELYRRMLAVSEDEGAATEAAALVEDLLKHA